MAGLSGLRGGTGATRSDGVRAEWKTPYELYDERRSVGASGSNAALSSSSPPSNATASSAAIADTINVRGITIAGWRIESHRGSIADSKTIDDLSDSLGIPLPEMPFDKNRLILRYEGSNRKGAEGDAIFEYSFDGMNALRSVEGVNEAVALRGITFDQTASTSSSRPAEGERNGHRKGSTLGSAALGQKPQKKRVQVSYANEWGKKRDQQQQPPPTLGDPDTRSSHSNFGPEVAMAAANGTIATARDFDWTYSCTWPGEQSSSSPAFASGKDPQRDRIPVEKLGPPSTPGAKAEPILFFDDLILFEDELGDNGTSLLNVKIRVMPTGLLVLQRFFLRVDNVLFRVLDTRMYVGFYESDDDVDSTPAAAATSRPPPTADMSRLSLGMPRKAPDAARPGSAHPQVARPFRVIRECCGYQERYASVRARLPPYKPNDLSPLTDPGWVAQQVTKMAEDRQSNELRRQPLHQQSHGSGLHPGTMVSLQQSDPTRPAVVPSTNVQGQESNRILGEVHDGGQEGQDADERWEGEGHRVDVALVYD